MEGTVGIYSNCDLVSQQEVAQRRTHLWNLRYSEYFHSIAFSRTTVSSVSSRVADTLLTFGWRDR